MREREREREGVISKPRKATCFALDNPIDKSSSISASQMSCPLKKSFSPFYSMKKQTI